MIAGDNRKPNVVMRRAEAFSNLGDVTTSRLLDRNSLIYFGVDTVFTLHPTSEFVWDWVRFRRNNVSSATLKLSNLTAPHRVHRLVLAQQPGLIANNFLRRTYRERLKVFLHMHLRDGTVLYVVFLDLASYSPACIQELMNFAFVASSGSQKPERLFRMPYLWTSRFAGSVEIAASEARSYFDYFWSKIREDERRDCLRLWYEPAIFENRRMERSRPWGSFRDLVRRIYNNVCQGPDCGVRVNNGDWEVDHIICVKASNNVLPNLRLLCRKCNRFKGQRNTHEAPFVLAHALLPDDIQSVQMKEIISSSTPDWVGRYSGPPRSVLTL